ncbi:carbon-nitrogen hydrolase family protein [Streptomyces sp. NPDC053431]|uniref:carbon-nitrogen hydrolase family protein n=1 Tax=Streptomyces sp. NPDC053431 TaxID=3365703 RepID=UPI0037D804DD
MRIACWQATCAPGGVPAFLESLRAVARRAAAGGAGLLVTPEMSVGGYPLSAAALAEAREPVAGPHGEAIAAIARETGVAIVHGWPEAAGAVVHNAAAVTSPEGRLLTYRKGHLFGSQERALFAPGSDGVVQTRLGGLTVGLLICYDVEFPEAVRAHALAGTELLVVPTALMRPWDFVARVVVPARAFENGLFIAYTNWTGARAGLDFAGLTRVAGPDGGLVTVGGDGEELLFADIDPARVVAARASTTYLQDRRPELYGPAP